MTPSKHPCYYNHHHHHHRTDNFSTTPSPPSSLLPPRRTRPPSLSLLQFNIHDELLGRRVSDASANTDANDPIVNTNTKASNDNNGEDDGDSNIPIRSRNASTCSHRSSNRSRSNLLLSDSEISVLDLGPSLGREIDGTVATAGSRSGSRSASLQVPGVRVGVPRRLCSSSSGGDGLSGLSHDAGDAGDGEKKGRYMDVQGRECDYGYGYGYEIDDDDEEGTVGQRPVLVLPCDGDGVDNNDAHGDHDGYAPAPAQGREQDNEHEHGTISSPLLVPLKTTRKAKRGVSWSKAFGV